MGKAWGPPSQVGGETVGSSAVAVVGSRSAADVGGSALRSAILTGGIGGPTGNGNQPNGVPRRSDGAKAGVRQGTVETGPRTHRSRSGTGQVERKYCLCEALSSLCARR